MRYEKALVGLFMQSEVWCKPLENGYTVYWPEGEEGRRQVVGYLGGIAAMSGKPWHIVGGDYKRLMLEIDESLVDAASAEVLRDRACVADEDTVEMCRVEWERRNK